MESLSQYPKPRLYGNTMKMSIPTLSQQSDNDRSSGELRALDCNLTSLCDHIQMEGFNSGSFSDIVVQVMGSTYHLHRLILSRSSYFRNMLHGPWKEARAQVVTLHIDDDNVNAESIAMALAYLYGHHPKLHDSNAFRVLAAASFLDLQDLCAICTDFIISDLWTSNFLAYQVFAESQDYGIHGERVKNACWGYLCQSGNVELKEVLPKLSSQTLHALLTSDELWVCSEEERFKLAVNTLLAKGSFSRGEHPEEGGSSFEIGTGAPPDSSGVNSTNLIGNCLSEQLMESEVARVSLKNDDEGHRTAHNILVELADCVVDYYTGPSGPNSQRVQQTSCSRSNKEPRYSCKMEPPPTETESNSFSNLDGIRTSCAYAEIPSAVEASRMGGNVMAMEGPSEESTYTHLNDNNWLPRDKSRHCSSATASCNGFMLNEWGRCGSPSPSWGGRIVGRRQVKAYAKGNYGVHGEEYDAFINIFEGGSLLYCNMTLKELVDARKQLEELGFPCKAVNDGLWLQEVSRYGTHSSVVPNLMKCETCIKYADVTASCPRLQEIVADSCKNCCLTSMACACRHAYGFSQGATTSSYYMQERVQVRGTIDGLAGIGRGTTFEPDPAWPPTRFVFSRVPFGLGNRNCQQSLANDEPEARADISGDLSGDGLTALVGLSQGGSSAVPVHGQQTERGYESDLHSRLAGSSVALASGGGIPVHMVESQSHSVGLEWENDDGYSITLDMKTPLRHFPPFRFGVEFEDVHRLSEAQVMASREVFYAGSLWKVTIQAFNDEDPQGRRTLGLFLHRRKAEITENPRKVPLYIDSREKVTARYQLICPSKREVMVFGSFKQTGTLLPKAPKGWGWRSALLFDELGDLLQGGALRISAVVQIV